MVRARDLECGIVEIRDCDLRKEYPPVQASVTLSILTLQFTPIEYRQAPPLLGEHTEAVLRELLGKSDGEIARLRANGVI